MRTALLALSITLVGLHAAPVTCRAGDGPDAWVGTPAELAATVAVLERDAAQAAGRAYPSGAPGLALLATPVRCTTDADA